MKINFIKTYRLRNEEHFWFMTEVKNIVEAAGVKYLDIQDVFDDFVKLYNKENDLLKKEALPLYCSQMEESDAKRDDYHRGIQLILKGHLRHADPEFRNAAKILKQIFDKYGDLRPLPYDEETDKINGFCAEMGKNKPLLEKLHLTEWVEMLKAENESFNKQMDMIKENFEEAPVSLKTTRRYMDKLYDELVSKIKAFSLVKGDWKYFDIADKINYCIDRLTKSSIRLQDVYPPRLEKYAPETFY